VREREQREGSRGKSREEGKEILASTVQWTMEMDI
jgi:hypothetical protein